MYSNRFLGAALLGLIVGFSAVLAPSVGAQEADSSPDRTAPDRHSQARPEPGSGPQQDPKPQAGQGGARAGEAAPEKSPPAVGDKPSQSEAKSESKQNQAPEEPTAEVAQPEVGWSEEVEKVLSKQHPESINDLRVIQDQVRQVVRACRKATVGVQVGGAVGSAVIVSPDGLVLTAGHVAMEPNKRVRFFFEDGSQARGVTLGVNRSVDSGMMRITDKGPWPYAPMAPAESTKPGDWVVGLGHPNGYTSDRAPPVRLGRVLFSDASTLCTDVTLVGGDSGGPLLNLRGQVVGIHSRIGRKIVSNYHVPVGQYHTTWDRLAGGQMWGGRFGAEEPARYRPWLGVAGNSTSGRCELTQVFPGLPAARAGLKVGDVITRFGEEDVDSFDQLAKLVLARKAGSRVKVQLEREGKPLTLQVRLGIIAIGFPGSPEIEEDS